jgi:hypothetical protein
MALNEFSTGFFLINAALILLLPRRWVLLPVLVVACYMTRGQGILIGPFHFTIIRLMVPVGIIRMLVRGDRLNRQLNGLDGLMAAWAAWLLTSSLFREDSSAALVYRLGLVYDVCGFYLLISVYCQSRDELLHLCKIVAIVLIPVSIEMLYEKFSAYNIFSKLGGVSEIPYIREGRVRAQGPFGHAILAGVVGAVCLPISIALWNINRKISVAGSAACLLMVYASTSSGPVMSALAGIFALWVWRIRQKAKMIIWAMVLGYIALDLVMKDPAYFIMARIDITGGSTGWHRARLIQSALEHFSEWWLAGTDFTRHWMASGVSWSQDHTDITNHYIQMGVWGGLPAMILFMLKVWKGFSYAAKTIRHYTESNSSNPTAFVVWSLGASLFVHSVNCISVSYFDQSFIFLYLVLAAINSAWSEAMAQAPLSPVAEEEGHSNATAVVS